MAKIINDFRDKELIVYMEDLISTYGETVKDVAANVRHPALTHELVARFKQSAEHKHEHGALSHLESIQYAVEKYFEFRASGSFQIPAKEHSDERISDTQLTNIMEEITGIAEQISYLDDEGNVVFLDVDEETEEEGLMFEDEAQSIEELTKGEKLLVWELFNMFIIDFEGLTMNDCDEGLKLLYEMAKPEGFSKIMLMYGGKSIDTGMRADKLDIARVTEFIKSKVPTNSFVR